MPFDNHCLTLAICFCAAQLRETRQTPVYARCRDYGRGEGPKAPRNVPPAHQMPGPAFCRARTNSREDTRGRGLREPRLAKATCCWRDRQPCYPSHVARATGMRGDPRVSLQPSKSLCWRKRFGDLGFDPRDLHEDARDGARAHAATPEYVEDCRRRKKVEMLVAHVKRILRLARLRLRGPNGAKDEFLVAARAMSESG